MRLIEKIIVHCSATKAGQNFTLADIDKWHRALGWKCCGYHYVVDLDGLVEVGRPLSMVGAHCRGENSFSIGICYIGGLDASGMPADTRTEQQRKAMRKLIEQLTARFHVRTFGHRDFSEKHCPCFNAFSEYRDIYDNLLKKQASEVYEVFGFSEK